MRQDMCLATAKSRQTLGVRLAYGLFLLLFLASGCAAPSSKSSSGSYQGGLGTDKTMARCTWEAREGRPDGGESSIALGFITFIPLVPYGPQRFTPERYYMNATMTAYNFRDDLSQTVVKDLTAAGLAKSVGYNTFGGVHNTASEGIYRIELALKEGVWNRNFTTYGCSVFGVYLWLIGLPVSYGSANLAFEAVVFAPDGKELGRRVFKAELPLTESAYVAHKFPRRLPVLYEQISPDFRYFVRDCLRAAPEPEAVKAASAVQASPPVSGGDVAERLKQLKELKDSGIFTEEEYQAKRKKLVEQF